MEKSYYRVYAQIDLDAIQYNIEQMKRVLAPGVKLFAVVKTDAYGHGAAQVAALTAEDPRIAGYAVATLEEGIALRKSGVTKTVLVLGYTFPEQYELLLANDISAAVYRLDMAQALSEAAIKAGRQARIHLAVDTGMSRIGLRANADGLFEAKQILALPNLHREGIFTHFAKADETDKAFSDAQLAAFTGFVSALKKEGYTFDFRHCANSAGIIDLPHTQLDAVRAGISMYGVYPSDEVQKGAVPLRPALSLKSTVVHVKKVEAGVPVSYGGTFVTKRETVIATVPVGYGDGYPRQLSNKGYVLIRGQKAPIVGRVCMDQLMVDATDIRGIAMRDEVTLIGEDGGGQITVEELGNLSGRFSYEFLCDLGKRIPRIYMRGGTRS